MDEIDERFYINVWDIMQNTILGEPRLRRKVVCDVDEWLPIVSVEVDLWDALSA